MTTTTTHALDFLAARIEAVEQADTAAALLRATRDLASALGAVAMEEREAPGSLAGEGESARRARPAIDCLVQVLGYNNPGAAVAAVDGLIAIGPAAVEPLLSGLDEHNYGARAWAVRALAGIGDVRGVELLETAAGGDIGASVRRAAARGLGRLQLETLPPEERDGMRERCLRILENTVQDGEWVVRYAVAVALEDLAAALEPGSAQRRRALEALGILRNEEHESTPVVRMRAALAQRRLDRP